MQHEAINYARNRRTGETLFFHEPANVAALPRPVRAWAFWALPYPEAPVRAIGETHDEYCARLQHTPGVCDACRGMR